MTYREAMREFQRKLFTECIERLGVTGAARELSMNRGHLHLLLKELDIRPVSPFAYRSRAPRLQVSSWPRHVEHS